jgi:cytochrome c553
LPKHIVRLLLLLAGLAVVAVTVRNHVVDKSFYKLGHYRADAVAEIAQDKPKFQGSASCESCHAVQFTAWSSSIHHSTDVGKVVKCEVCHGPGGGRDPDPGYLHAATGPVHPINLKLAVPTDSRANCGVCHEQIAGRPQQQRQIVISDHAGTQQCTLCHDPHSPQTFNGSLVAPTAPGNAVAGKSQAGTCAACHGATGITNASLPGPTLAGQNQAYLIAALTAYKTGKRSNPIMTGMAATVNNADINNIASYFSGLKCESSASIADQATAARKAGAMMCTNCHGTNGFSTSNSWPNLAGQSKDYIAAALKSYAGGQRSNVIMATLAKSLSGPEIDKVATYYAGATCK